MNEADALSLMADTSTDNTRIPRFVSLIDPTTGQVMTLSTGASIGLIVGSR